MELVKALLISNRAERKEPLSILLSIL